MAHAHPGGRWTREKLVCAVKRLVAAGRAPEILLVPAPRTRRGGRSDDVLRTSGTFLAKASGLMLAEFKRKLEHHRIRPPSLAPESPISTLARQVSRSTRGRVGTAQAVIDQLSVQQV